MNYVNLFNLNMEIKSRKVLRPAPATRFQGLYLSSHTNSSINNKIIKIFFTGIYILAVTGCTHYYYIPKTHNVPLFREKNEYRAIISSGQGSEITTTDVQAAYSITNKFAIMTNFMLASGGTNLDNFGKGKYFDGAFGYFKPISKHGVFEIFGGYGGGNQHHSYNNADAFGKSKYSNTADLSLTKIFLQPSLGTTYNGFDIAVTSGFSRVSFNKINNQIDKLNEEYIAVENISQKRTSILFEPSLTIRGGWKYAKLQIQLVSSNNLSHSNLKFESSQLSFGLVLSFAQRFRKQINTPPASPVL